MLYDLQANQPRIGKEKRVRSAWRPVLITDTVSSSKRRIYNRLRELTKRGQQCRIIDQTGRLLTLDEIEEFDR